MCPTVDGGRAELEFFHPGHLDGSDGGGGQYSLSPATVRPVIPFISLFLWNIAFLKYKYPSIGRIISSY